MQGESIRLGRRRFTRRKKGGVLFLQYEKNLNLIMNQKFGFVPSFKSGVYHKSDSEAPWCMGKELVDGSLENISGIIDIV